MRWAMVPTVRSASLKGSEGVASITRLRIESRSHEVLPLFRPIENLDLHQSRIGVCRRSRSLDLHVLLANYGFVSKLSVQSSIEPSTSSPDGDVKEISQ